MQGELTVRPYKQSDQEAVWGIINQVIAGGETYVFYPDSSRDKMMDYWLAREKKVYVVLYDDAIAGTFNIKANMPDRASHVANASYMVSPTHEGKGIGLFMANYSLKEAKRLGYLAMQFNIVIKSNDRAVGLWKKVGFRIIGEIPNAFDHPRLGMTNAYVMYKEL